MGVDLSALLRGGGVATLPLKRNYRITQLVIQDKQVAKVWTENALHHTRR